MNLTHAIHEVEYAKILRQTEQIYHMSAKIDHSEECFLCNKPQCAPLVSIWDLYFNINGCHYYSMFRTSHPLTNKRLTYMKHFPKKELWQGLECKLCNGTMDKHENAIALRKCKHVFHEYCLYDYMYKKTLTENLTPEIENELNMKCPIENCNKHCYEFY